MLADDIKLIATIRNSADLEVLQSDLDALLGWSTAWRMMFNVDLCKVMEFNKSGNNQLEGTELLMGEFRSVINFTSSKNIQKNNIKNIYIKKNMYIKKKHKIRTLKKNI